MTGKNRKQQSTILRGANNEIILDVEAKLHRWTVYIEQLFNDNRPNLSHPHDDKKENGPEITKSEVIHAINVQKNAKATGPVARFCNSLFSRYVVITTVFVSLYNEISL